MKNKLFKIAAENAETVVGGDSKSFQNAFYKAVEEAYEMGKKDGEQELIKFIVGKGGK